MLRSLFLSISSVINPMITRAARVWRNLRVANGQSQEFQLDHQLGNFQSRRGPGNIAIFAMLDHLLIRDAAIGRVTYKRSGGQCTEPAQYLLLRHPDFHESHKKKHRR
jgi:hypothetical protein